MEFTITALLAVFVLLLVTSGVYLLAERFKLPYTVLLVATGLAVLYPLTHLPIFSFLQDFSLTPELLFYLFLPVLIFESAFNINVRRLSENILTISSLAIVSLVLSAFLIASTLFVLLPLVGINAPFILCLLFGALISATDPVAVLALFKEIGAPRRLTLLFEGESIFNDGTAVGLFFVILAITEYGYHGVHTVLAGVGTFVVMVLGGVLFGLVMGFLFSRMLSYARDNEFVQITLMLVMAHITFIVTDLMSEHITIGTYDVRLSAIIATAVASIVLGNYGRAKISPRAEEFVEKFWAQTAFVSNSLVFVLIGLIFATLPVRFSDLILPILLSVIVVAAARAGSVYPVLAIVNRLRVEEPVSRTWQHVLAWGSLRGALAITMVLFIPQDLSFPGWTALYSPYEFVVGLTIGCIFATLFIKATTIERMMRKLGLRSMLPIEALELDESRALVHERVIERLDRLCSEGHVTPELLSVLRDEHTKRLVHSQEACARDLSGKENEVLGERILRMYTIGIERQTLRELYVSGEVNERVYRAILHKLQTQYDHADRPTIASTRKLRCAWCAQLFLGIRTLIAPEYRPLDTPNSYLYYRTNTVLAQSVLNTLKQMERKRTHAIFGAHAFEHVRHTYQNYVIGSRAKMERHRMSAPEHCAEVAERLARHSILRIEERTLDELTERRMITPKIQTVLRRELENEADRLSARYGDQ